MSRKTNISKKPVVRSYGIQSYRAGDKKDYSEIIGTPTFFAANAAFVVRESEFARPYKAEDYGEMEYAAPLWPGFDWPGVDFPGMGLPVPDFPGMYDPWHMNFRCDVSPCWCEGETKTFAANCTYEIINAQFVPSEDDLSVTFSKNTISIKAASGIRSGEGGYLTITMKANVPKGGSLWQGKYNPVYGTHSSISVSECSDCESCDDSGMAWDSENSAETIAQSGEAAVNILDSLGAGGPYSWSVSGTGFTLDNAETTGVSNTLNADASACGSATITCTGCGGNSVTGFVRCTTGTWVLKADACPNPGPHTARTNLLHERVVNNTKVEVLFALCTQCALADYSCALCNCYASCVDENPNNWCGGDMCMPFDCTAWGFAGWTQNCCEGVEDSMGAQCFKCDTYEYYEWECV